MAIQGFQKGNILGVPIQSQEYSKNLSKQKLDSLIEQVGTKSTGELARNGGIMGYGRG